MPPLPARVGGTAAEYRLYCERQAGVLLLGIEKNKGTAGTGDANIGKNTGGNMTEPPVDAAPTLADIGITKRQSSEYQQLAWETGRVFVTA